MNLHNTHNQLEKSSQQWNRQDDVLTGYEEHYSKRGFMGDRLVCREKKALEFLDSLCLPKNAKVLELGYGPGNTSFQIVQRGFSLYGVDISNYFCQLATHRCQQIPGAKVKLEVGDAENLKYNNNYFDCVLGIGFLQYMKDPLRCLKEVCRVLKPNGYFIIAQRNDFSLASWDNPYHFTKLLINWSTRRKHLFRYRDTFLLDLALGTFRIMRMKKWITKFERHKEIGLVKKNVMSYKILSTLLEQANYIIVKNAGAGFRSKLWYEVFPDAVDLYIQRKSDARERPYPFANGFVFLARKRESVSSACSTK